MQHLPKQCSSGRVSPRMLGFSICTIFLIACVASTKGEKKGRKTPIPSFFFPFLPNPFDAFPPHFYMYVHVRPGPLLSLKMQIYDSYSTGTNSYQALKREGKRENPHSSDSNPHGSTSC